MPTRRSDDRLLDAIARGDLPSDEPLAVLLHEWRADIRGEPPARAPARWVVWRRPVAVTIMAAIVAGAGASVAAAATVTEPGDPLWPVTKIVAPDRAEKLEAEREEEQERERIEQPSATLSTNVPPPTATPGSTAPERDESAPAPADPASAPVPVPHPEKEAPPPPDEVAPAAPVTSEPTQPMTQQPNQPLKGEQPWKNPVGDSLSQLPLQQPS